jgi:hypothetical protein
VRGPDVDPTAGVPLFPRALYRYYVRVTSLSENATGVDLAFELHRFEGDTWTEEGAFTAALEWSSDDRAALAGGVRDATGGDAGELELVWVSPYLRRAVIEVVRVPASDRPVSSAAGVDWRKIFDDVGWDLTIVESDDALVEPSGESWGPAELHAAMLQCRDQADLDAEWRYWLLCVRQLDGDDARGLMFDRDASDSDNVPREAAAIASHWTIPDEDGWGRVRGMRFGEAVDCYFRTAVHEIGHAMCLYHNTADNGFMSTTDTISRSVVPPQQFPENILWSHAEKDKKRLRHMPDPWVRPGGMPFGASYGTAPIVSADATVDLEGARLDVEPLLAAVPIGAPVRVRAELHNERRDAVPAPRELSLKTGYVRGSVTDPSGTVRSFRSLVTGTEVRLAELPPGAARAGSLTLLRGPQGALFPAPGPHTVDVTVEWSIDGVPVRVSGRTTVTVLAAVDASHREAARKVLGTPDLVLTLAFGGDHLEDGLAAVQAALANDVLRPHYAFVEAKRLATRFRERAPDIEGAAALIDGDTVMSHAELGKAARLVGAAAERGEAPPTQLVDVLRARAQSDGAHHAANLLDSLKL